MIRRYFYDFEFLEDGRTIDPISVGVVCDDGREYYAVVEEIAGGGRRDQKLHDRICQHDWLMRNVIPHLPLRDTFDGKGYNVGHANTYPKTNAFHLDLDAAAVLPRHVIAKQLRAFLLYAHDEAGAGIELWAYFAAYDHVALAQLLGGPMVHMPKGLPFWTHDLKQEMDRLGVAGPNDLVPRNRDEEHDALADAQWNYRVWQVLAEMEAAHAAR